MLIKDSLTYGKGCDKCQMLGTISTIHEMQLSNIIEVEILRVSDIEFISPFHPSNGNQYILLFVYYVFLWVDAVDLPSDGARVVIKLIKKHIFTLFITPIELISDGAKNFINYQVKNLLAM